LPVFILRKLWFSEIHAFNSKYNLRAGMEFMPQVYFLFLPEGED